jgi:pyruvate/2-oxoglutarate dehydrogenase complex dihydrolipoamide acyltransferase (E2) component
VGTIGPVESIAVGNFPPLKVLVAELLIAAMLEKPVAKDEKVQIRKIMNVALLWDHRVLFANTPIEFLNELKKRGVWCFS